MNGCGWRDDIVVVEWYWGNEQKNELMRKGEAQCKVFNLDHLILI